MGTDSLKDLVLAGVHWELSDTAKSPHQTIPNESRDKRVENKDIPKAEHRSQLGTPVSSSPNSLLVTNYSAPAAAPVPPAQAQLLARGAGDIDSLCAAIAAFDHPLKQFAKNTVPPHLRDASRLLIITDSPSTEDDETGRILSGAAGELLDKMLGAIGLTRETVSIIPLVFWRAPGGRTPTREELDLARPFIDRAIELLQPAAILTLGTLARTECAQEGIGHKAYGIDESKTNQSSQLQNKQQAGDNLCPMPYALCPIFSIFHPNYLLLKPDAKKAAWETLQELQKSLNSAEK